MRHRDPQVRLAERALRCNYAITDEQRAAMVAMMVGIVLDPEQKARARTAAYRAILISEKANLNAVETAIRAEVHEDLVAKIEELEGNKVDDFERPRINIPRVDVRHFTVEQAREELRKPQNWGSADRPAIRTAPAMMIEEELMGLYGDAYREPGIQTEQA